MDSIDLHNKKINLLLKKNKQLLIEAFVKYYGENKRSIITNKINEVVYCWNIHKFLIEFYEKYKYKNIKPYIKYPKNTIIGATEDLGGFKKIIIDSLNQCPNNYGLNLSFYDINYYFELIVFPLFISNDKVLIHELNHIVCRTILGYTEFNGEYIAISKNGLDNTNSDYELLEEIINERSANTITRFFHKMGGNILEKDYRLEIGNEYEKMFPIINNFYKKYNMLLREIRIGDNHNMLFKYFNKDVFNLYNEFVKSVFKEIKTAIMNGKKYKIPNEYILESNQYVENMDKYKTKRLY